MNSKITRWTIDLAALLAIVFLAIGCSKSKVYKPGPDITSNESSAPVPGYLDQGWNHDTSMEWWYTSQGSRIIPYDWFRALERSDSEEMFNSKTNLEERLRFIGRPAEI